MITTTRIEQLIKNTLQEKNCFVVELAVNETNNISLKIDSLQGVTMADCIDFSRAIEHNLDREIEDFQLNVSSPGLDKPFIVKEQYIKNIGRNVKVTRVEGNVIKGILTAVNDDDIIIEFSYKEKIEGKKKKQIITKQEKILFNNIKETTIIISFKK